MEIGGMSCFVSTEARLACHLRLTVGCFSLFRGQDQKCQYSLLQEERWRWFIAEEQSHRIFIASKTSLENLPRSCLGVLISSLFCKYIAKGLHSFVLRVGLVARKGQQESLPYWAGDLGEQPLLSPITTCKLKRLLVTFGFRQTRVQISTAPPTSRVT